MVTKVGVLGSGGVAKVLAQGALKHGYSVMIGSRTVAKVEAFAKGIDGMESGTLAETAAFGEIVILAIKGHAAEATVKGLDVQLRNKTVIDACNPIDESKKRSDNIVPFFKLPGGISLMEHLQNAVPQAKFVKAFNSVGSKYMVDPDLDGGRPSMFICGNDDEAKVQVTELLEKFKWDVVDVGGVRAAYCIEQLCVLWCARGFKDKSFDHAFKLLVKDS